MSFISINNEDAKYKILNIFNIKISLKKNYYNKFIKHEIRENSILIVEINACHGETIPGFINYFQKLNYNVDIIVSYYMVRDKVLDRFAFNNINLFYMTENEIYKVLTDSFYTKYKYLFFNTSIYYETNRNLIYDIINKNIVFNKDRIILVEHTIDNLKLLKKNTITLLPNSSKCKWVNPHYFGEKKLKSKNRDIIKFLLTAREANSAKNLDLLIDSIRDVIKSGINNFKVIFTGRIANLNININDIKDNVEFTGYLDYVQLYKYCEDADFILPMLDPNIESHKRFFEDVSGSFQLVYGFGIVPIVHKAFSLRYGLDSDNSLVYNNYDEFIQKFKYAVNMSDWEYKSKVKNILDYSNKLDKQSLLNLKSILKD